MARDKLAGLVAALSVIIFLIFILLSVLKGVPTYIPDHVIFLVIVVILYFSFYRLKLNLVTYTLLVLGMITHSVGIFGWYANSPVSVQWDHITHFAPWFAMGLILFNYFRPHFGEKLLSRKSLGLSLVLLLALMGIGTFTESLEFFGYIALGTGEGGFYFGAGDALSGQPINQSDIDAYGGGWINTMWDLINDTLGAIAAMIVVWVVQFWVRRDFEV